MTNTEHTITTKPERQTSNAGRDGWYAKVKGGNGYTLEVSRLDDDRTDGRWVVDSMFTGSGVPVFVIGFGGRYCALTLLAEHIGAELDALVVEAEQDEPAPADEPGPFDEPYVADLHDCGGAETCFC